VYYTAALFQRSSPIRYREVSALTMDGIALWRDFSLITLHDRVVPPAIRVFDRVINEA
jgi:hypothetical protein